MQQKREVINLTNVDKLKGTIIEKRLSPEKVAELIGIDKSTMYRKLNNGGDEFTIKQADSISKVLGLTAEEAQAIFFSQFVA
jgi:plasmid maintenance system antidote protein VapI